MAQSPEYSDLTWMPPKSWDNSNRTSVQLVVIHTTEGSEGPNSAEDGAAYDQRRTDGTSTHFFHDSNTTVQCVRTEDQAHAARTQGNRRGIQHELCGRAGQGSVGWADTVSQGTLRQAARQVARDCKKWGIPVRKLSAGQVASGMKGICGHVEITYAFPQDNGTHTDPGPTFPWSAFLALVQGFTTGTVEEDVALTAGELTDIAQAVWSLQVGRTGRSAHDTLFADMQGDLTRVTATGDAILKNVVADDGDLANIQAAIAAQTAPTAAAVIAALGGGEASANDVAQAFMAALGVDKAKAAAAIVIAA